MRCRHNLIHLICFEKSESSFRVICLNWDAEQGRFNRTEVKIKALQSDQRSGVPRKYCFLLKNFSLLFFNYNTLAAMDSPDKLLRRVQGHLIFSDGSYCQKE